MYVCMYVDVFISIIINPDNRGNLLLPAVKQTYRRRRR